MFVNSFFKNGENFFATGLLVFRAGRLAEAYIQVDIALDSGDAALRRILPDGKVVVVFRAVGVFSQPELDIPETGEVVFPYGGLFVGLDSGGVAGKPYHLAEH